MNFNKGQTAFLIALAVSTEAFGPAAHRRTLHQSTSQVISSRKGPLHALHMQTQEDKNEGLYFATPVDETKAQQTEPLPMASETTPTPNATKPTAMPKKKGGAAAHKEGIFSPAVLAAKKVLGDEELNKVRAKAISLHADVIKSFVGTADSPFGQSVLVRLFALADKNKDGKLDASEVALALNILGFSWLQDKQVSGIVKRADFDENGEIDFEEFVAEAPKTLKTNLVKLAKKNGADLGFLS
jgi:hypothetical protein